MSLAAAKAVRARSDARGSARLVLLEFADHATDDGRSWASVPTIARGCRCSERTAYRLTAELVAAGELVPVGRKLGKYRGAVEYQIAACLPDRPLTDPAPAPEMTPVRADRVSADPCQNRSATPDKTGNGPLTGLSPNPSENPLVNPREAAAAVEQAVSEFNKLADEVGLVRVQRLTAKRRALLEARLAECGGLDGWREIVANIRGSPGLVGENERGWRLDFDWLIDENNFARLAEGQYDGWTGNRTNGSGRRRETASDRMLAGWAAAANRAAGRER